MRKMPLRFARRVRNLEIKSSYYCPTKKKPSSSSAAGYLGVGGRRDSCSSSLSSSHHHHHQQICPSCVLPIVVAFIFGFTVIQLIVIHRTIVAYKSRSLAFEEVYGPSHNDTKSQGDLLAFSKKFDSALLPIVTVFNASGGSSSNGPKVVYEWKPTGQAYPYRIPPRHNMNHIWTKVKCPEVSSGILGNMSIDVKSDVSLDSLTRNNPHVKPGGKWSPEDCSARFHVALIIPYRYRWNHLKLLLSLLHPMLRRQKMSYQIFVAEQFGNYTFNKGLLMNAAFLLALNSSTAFDCVIFHDVDLLPETDTNIYGCAKSPSHLSVSIDAYGYRLPYSKLVGGVFAISVEHFIQVNGYSNLYWGWGAEDDDMYKRLIANQLPLNRPRPDLAKYKMLQHGRRVPNQFINPLIRTARLRFPQDGLTTCHFRLVSSSSQALFTRFLVDVGQPSWSVLEPHVHLESMIPSAPSSPSLVLHSHRSTISSPNIATTSIKHTHSRQHHHHHSSSAGETKAGTSSTIPRKNNEPFMLTGIARDYSNNHLHRPNKNKKMDDGAAASHSQGRQVRSILSSIGSQQPKQLSQPEAARKSWLSRNLQRQQEESQGTRQIFDNRLENDAGRSHNEDIPLDPDVPVLQDDEDEEDDEDLQGGSDGEA